MVMLIPWNCVVSTVPFYAASLPNTNIVYMISFAMNGVMALVTILCVIFADPAKHRALKINFMFLVAGIFLMFLPLVVHSSLSAFEGIWPSYWITLFSLCIFGILTTISQASCLSLMS